MCRERPGPRCTQSGRHRYEKAHTNYSYVRGLYTQALDARNGDRSRVPAAISGRLDLATNRMNAANLVYWATPGGQKELAEDIQASEERLAENFPDGVPQDVSSGDRERHSHLQRRLASATNRRNEGIARRENSYADLKMVRGERSALREQATARGGNIGSNAHPLSPARAEELREDLDAAGVQLREWGPEDVSRAGTWVEAGSSPRRFSANARLRPFPRGRDEDGRTIQVGSTVEGEKPQQIMVRLNTPDGQVVEGVHALHLTKNDDGKYVVSARSRVASSWEDASPIDRTKQELGHIVTDPTSGKAESKMVIGTATSKREAKRILAEAKRNFNAAQTTALMGRDILTSRAQRRSSALQRRGFVVWHRYANPNAA